MTMKQKFSVTGFAWLAIFSLSLLTTACKKILNGHKLAHFDQENLVDNNHEYGAAHTDSTLMNAWGIAFNPTGIPWVNSQAGHVSEVYDKDGKSLRPPVAIPGVDEKTPGNPSGIVYNGSDADFILSNSKAAKFIFVGVDGVISAWNPDAGASAISIANNSSTSAYTGLAIATVGGKSYLFAADFRSKKIVTWDGQWVEQGWNFSDPDLPSGYAPYNVQASGDWLWVTYAKVGDDGEEEVGAGNGVVDIFKTSGEFVKRFTNGGALNAPWGIAEAKPEFFKDNEDDSMAVAAMSSTGKNMVLVGNFGDGKINVFTWEGKLVGALKSRGHDIVIPGLWAIMFPPATATSVDPDRLYFAAGPDDEKDGLFGYIQKK